MSAVKGDDVFVDIGYKSSGAVDITEFGDAAPAIGDKVTVEISPYDLGKGRITFRHKV